MKTKFLIALLLPFLVYGCNRISNVETNTYSVNLSECRQTLPVSAIFDSVFIIPLESENVPLIGQTATSQPFGDFIYILDKKKESIFVFSNSGKFVREINKKGKGPGEYADIIFFEINPYEESIDILSKTGALYRYTLEGTFIEYYPSPGNLRAASYFTNLNKDTLVFYTSSEPNRLTFFSKSTKNVISQTLNLPVHNLGSSISPFYTYKDNLYLFELFESQRYRITNAGLEDHFCINLGEDPFTTKDIHDYGTKRLHNESLQGELNKPFFWTNIENDNYIITTYRKKSNNCTVIINKQTNKITNFKLFDNGCNFPFGATFYRDYLFYVVPSHYIPMFINEELKSEFGITDSNQRNEYGNPVIILYKLKQNI